jgi:DNA-binding CsgD family transcriptional regulator/PAS domain-containing protein
MYENAEQALGEIQSLLPLIELIYDASDDTSLWPVVLDRIAEVVNGEQIALFSNNADPAVPNVASLARMEQQDLAPYTAYYRSANILAEGCDAPFPAGTVRYSPPAEPDARVDSSEICRDCRQPHGMLCRFGLKMPVNDRPVAYLTCMRPRQMGHFNEKDGAILRALRPHLQRSLRCYLQREQAKSETNDLKSVLDSFDRAVFGLNRNGMVVLSNQQAARIVEDGDGLKLVCGRLMGASVSENAQLQSQIAKAVENGFESNSTQGAALHLRRNSERLPLQITVTPFGSNSASNPGQLAALVFVSDPAEQPKACSALLRQLYGLSPTECRLADLLHQGLEVRDVAERLKTTLETARFHLKRVLAKTGTRRQTELMRLMLSLPGQGISR